MRNRVNMTGLTAFAAFINIVVHRAKNGGATTISTAAHKLLLQNINNDLLRFLIVVVVELVALT